MSRHRALPATTILAAGLGVGILGDELLRAPGEPGLNMFLMFLALAISTWLVSLKDDARLSREAAGWLGVGLLCAAALMWRGSGMLRFGTFVAACTAFSLPALRAGRAWATRGGALDIVEALGGAGLYAAFGCQRLIAEGDWERLAAGAPRHGASGFARAALGGTLLAVAPLVVFGTLFVSADEVFADIVGNLIRIDLSSFASHVIAIGALSWLASGYLVGVVSGTRFKAVRRLRRTMPTVGVGEVATALGLVNLLFLGFVIVQLRYLFGGGAWVEGTPGLTYAEYARSGFFQLVTAVALAIPWLLVAHALLDRRNEAARSAFRALAGVHLVLLLAVVASAIQRMLVYQEAYGLTELRVIVSATLVWLTVIVVWFGATVLGGHRDRFAFGVLASAFVLTCALQVLNPASIVTRHNLDRIEELNGVDATYLASLGSDAVPLLLARLDELPVEERCRIADQLLSRWSPDSESDWRTYNWSDSRARRSVGDNLVELRRHTGPGSCD